MELFGTSGLRGLEDVSTNPYVVYNIGIDLWDIVAVALELGREIPA